jgi:hypothetical protein
LLTRVAINVGWVVSESHGRTTNKFRFTRRIDAANVFASLLFNEARFIDGLVLSSSEQVMSDYPAAICVVGAGHVAVNGNYIWRKNIRWEATFVMEGRWNDQAVTFQITHECSSKKWILGYSTDNPQELIHLYHGNRSNDYPELPPLRGWWDVAGAAVPPVVHRVGWSLPADWRDLVEYNDADRWTICINNTTKYHVHRYVLQNAAEYFRGLLCSEFAEHQENTSNINVCPSVASSFPCFLDYMYTYHGEPIRLATPANHLCPLFWMGRYFGVPQLVDDISRCIDLALGGLDAFQLVEYVESARKVKFQLLLDKLASKLFYRVREGLLKVDEAVQAVPDAMFWYNVLAQFNNDDIHCKKKNLLLVLEICKKLPLSEDLFQKLTDPSRLPPLDLPIAFLLLKKEADLQKASQGASLIPTRLQEQYIDLILADITSDACQNALPTLPRPLLAMIIRRYQERIEDVQHLLDAYSADRRSGKRSRKVFINKVRDMLL